MKQTVKYSYRAYPTSEQQRWLAGAFGAARTVYNDYIWQKERVHEGLQTEVVSLDRYKLLPADKLWMKKYPQRCMQQSVRQAQIAYKNFFDGVSGSRKDKPGKPRYKRKKSGGALTWCGGSLKVKKLNRKWAAVRLPKHGTWVKFKLSRELPSDPTGVTLKLLPSGQYKVSFTVRRGVAEPKESGSSSAVDFGLIDLVTVVCDDGLRYKVPAPKNYRRAERKLARLERNLSRKAKDSKNREKARLSLAKQYEKVANQRLDLARKIAFQLCSENQAVGLEDLTVKGLIRTRFAKSFSDAAIGQLKSCIQQAGQKLGAAVLLVSPAYTSQKCSICGQIDGKKPLSVREWTCSHCGAELDRDYNAAVNILLLAVGQPERLNACGGSIVLASPAPTSESGTTFKAYRPRRTRSTNA